MLRRQLQALQEDKDELLDLLELYHVVEGPQPGRAAVTPGWGHLPKGAGNRHTVILLFPVIMLF